MTFLAPVWLLTLIPLGVALWVFRPPTWLLFALRSSAITLVVLALAGLAVGLPSRAGTVVVIADRSLSMPADTEKLQKEWIDLIHSKMSTEDRLAVVSFGQQVAVEHAPSTKGFDTFAYEVGGNASSLGEAVEAALSLIPRDSPGRLLVLSDGKWTGRDPAVNTPVALSRNVSIDYRVMSRPPAGDLAIARIDSPSVVSSGESFLVNAWVSAPSPQEVEFTLKRGDTVIATGKRQLISGMNRLTFRDRGTTAGNQSYSLVVTGPEKDPVLENNTAKMIVGVGGPKPLLHVSESPKSGLAALLQKGGLRMRSIRPQQTNWSLEELSRYSGVILENTPADKIGLRGLETMSSWVRETGSGLMMTGGRSSYGPGGYYKSPLEPIMPVSMELRNEHRKLRLAIVVALDRSGSMSVPVGGGKKKMDLANLGAAQVVDLLGPQDEFGCIAVDSEAHVIAPLGELKDKENVRSQVLRIESQGGGIYAYVALAKAADMLMKANAGTKHIILFSDSNDTEEPGDYRTLLAKCEKAGITVSVIALGTERDQDADLCKDIARAGKGRIFFTDRPEELPRVFAQDTFVVARNTFIDEPTLIHHTPGLDALTDQKLPSPKGLALGGYNLCYLRPEANLGSVTEDTYGAPVVASWRAGTGRVVCFTGEADGKYAGNFSGWDKAGEFYTSLARWTAGASGPLKDNMLLTQEVREGVNLVQLHLDPERRADPFASLPKASILRSQAGLPLKSESAPMRWMGPDTLGIEVPLSGETALTTVDIPGHGPVSLAPVCLPYSPEFKPMPPDRGPVTLERLARATGGKERVELPSIWHELPRQVRVMPVGTWLILLAVMAVLLEVFERRTLVLSNLLSWRKKREAVVAEEKPIRNKAPAAARTRKAAPTPAANTPVPEVPVPTAPAAEPAPEPVVKQEDVAGMAGALRKARQRARGRLD